MRKSIQRFIFIALTVAPLLTYGQVTNDEQYLKRNMNKGNTTTLLKRTGYSQSSIDTTSAHESLNWKSVLLYTQVFDSVSMVIKVQTSSNDSTWSVAATVDSVVNVNDNGDAKITDVTSKVVGAYRYRFIIGPSGTKVGVTTSNYTVIQQRKSN